MKIKPFNHQVIGISSGVTVFLVQFVALFLDSRMGDEARTYFRVFVGDFLAVIALVSTVSNLRGIWMMLISLIPVGKVKLKQKQTQ
jgi:hypothetical protein